MHEACRLLPNKDAAPRLSMRTAFRYRGGRSACDDASIMIDGEAVVVKPDGLSRFDSAAITAGDTWCAPTREHLVSNHRALAPTLAARTLAPRCELASPI
jgi:hypothetical protein